MAKARVNQAAINYHFKGKDGLYFELLKIAFEKLMEQLEDLIRRNLNRFPARKRSTASCINNYGRCCFVTS